MLIVVEGTDASGKTTLVSEIQKQLKDLFPDRPVEFFHKSKPEEMTRRWVLKDYVTSIENVDWTSTNAIADRWHWGEVTYAPLKRPESSTDGYGLLGVAGWRWVELFLASRGVSQVWLYQPLEVLKKRLASRGDDYVSVDELDEILAQYRKAGSQTATDFTIFEPEPDSLDDVPELARKIIGDSYFNSVKARKLKNFPWYIGNPNPHVLLVGDTQNVKSEYGRETILPFMPVNANSGEFLLSSFKIGRAHV